MCSAKSARKFFNEHSQIWDNEINARQVKRIREIFADKLSFIESPFLDLGSGTGVLVPVLKEYDKNKDGLISKTEAKKIKEDTY